MIGGDGLKTMRAECPLLAISGHSEAQERLGLKKQTLDVRLASESGHALDTRLPEAHPPLSVPDLAAVKHTPCLWVLTSSDLTLWYNSRPCRF